MKKTLLNWILASLVFAMPSVAHSQSVTDTSKAPVDTIVTQADSTEAQKTIAKKAATDSLTAVANLDSILKSPGSEVIARFQMGNKVRVWRYVDNLDTSKCIFNKYGKYWTSKSDQWKITAIKAAVKNKKIALDKVTGKKLYVQKYFLDNFSKRYYTVWDSGKRYDVNKVHMLVKQGILLEIEATVGTHLYRNKSTAIDLVHFEDYGGVNLSYTGIPYMTLGKDLFVFLDDVITYSPMRSYSDVPYSDFDIALTRDTAHNYYNLTESTSLNSYFTVAAFTDIKGLSGAPNGLAQFQGEGKFITNTRPVGLGATVPFSFVAFEGGLAKYDSQYKGTMLSSGDSINRQNLFQRTTYSVGLKFNLLHGFQSPKPVHPLSDWQLNVGYNFLGSKVGNVSFKDSAHTVVDTAFKTVIQNDFYIEPMLTLSRNGNFALTASLPMHFVNVKSSANISNAGWDHWIAPTIELMYFAKKDPNSKVFFRYRYFSNMKDHSQGFTQIQFGYSIYLSSIWSPSPVK